MTADPAVAKATRVSEPSALEQPEQRPLRLALIYNPTAGRRRRRLLAAVLDRLGAARCEVAVKETLYAGQAETLAADLAGGAIDRLVVAGGDGTINEVVNGLASVADAPPLAIIPLGTANVLASEIGLQLDPQSIATTILQGEPHRISLGRAGDRFFVLMAGAGFDAWTVATVNLRLKRRIGKGAYVWATLRNLFRFPFRDYEVVVDGTPYLASSVIAANARHYGGPYVVAAGADLRDPTLQVCLFTRGGRYHALRYGLALVTGHLPRLADLRILTGQNVTIRALPKAGVPDALEEPVQGDGDILGRLPLAISVVPQAISLVFPANSRRPLQNIE